MKHQRTLTGWVTLEYLFALIEMTGFETHLTKKPKFLDGTFMRSRSILEWTNKSFKNTHLFSDNGLGMENNNVLVRNWSNIPLDVDRQWVYSLCCRFSRIVKQVRNNNNS